MTVKRNKQPKARAFTAIELLATMSILSVVTVASAQILVRVLDTSEKLRSSQRDSIVLDRLARDWRSDVRSATKVDLVSDEGTLCRLTDDNGRVVVFKHHPDESIRLTRLIRECRNGDVLVERAVYDTPANTSFQVSIDRATKHSFAQLTATTMRPDAVHQTNLLQITAAIDSMPARHIASSETESQP